MKELRGRTALVTGASRGLGRMIATALAGEGMKLVLAARSAAELAAAASEVRARGATALVVPTDVSDESALEALVAAANRELGGVDLLVNNAGVELALSHDKLTAREIEDMVEINLTAPMLLTRLVLPGMLERRRGHIVNIASAAGKACVPWNAVYSATKAGLGVFSLSLRDEVRERGVGVSVVVPTFVAEVGMFAERMQSTSLHAPAVAGSVSPHDVVRAVVRAVRDDVPEIIVSRLPIRPLAALGQLFPGLIAPLTRMSGASGLFRRVAEKREKHRRA